MMSSEEHKIIYSPQSLLRHPVKMFIDFLRDLVGARELIMALFFRDLKALYRQTVLGYIWIIVPPVATTCMWFYLNSQNLVNVAETSIPYPVFVLVGQILWGTFSAAIMTPLNTFNMGKAVFMKQRIAPEAFIFAGIAKNLFDIFVKLLFLIPVLLFFRITISWTFLLFLVDIFVLVIFGLGLGVFLIPIGSLYQDVAKGFTVLLPFIMYLAPVVYPPPADAGSLSGLIVRYNPLTPLIMAGRDWLTTGSSPYVEQVVLIGGISLGLFLVGSIILRVVLPRLVERMGM